MVSWLSLVLAVLLGGYTGPGLEGPVEAGVGGKTALAACLLGLDALPDQLLGDQDPADYQVLVDGNARVLLELAQDAVFAGKKHLGDIIQGNRLHGMLVDVLDRALIP